MSQSPAVLDHAKPNSMATRPLTSWVEIPAPRCNVPMVSQHVGGYASGHRCCHGYGLAFGLA